MEKLQAALERARKSRKRDSHFPSRTARGSRPEEQEDARTARWQALPSLDVDPRKLKARRVVTREASAAAAPFDILRTKVLMQMRQNGWKRLAITSPMPKSGKTTTACNLILGLARQNDIKAILMDLDLRDPSVHSFFNAAPPHGIDALMTGQVPFARHGLRIGDNIAVSMARGPVADPTRILLAQKTSQTLDRLEAEYDPHLMIFDLPSVLVNDDTRAFVKNVDCALIVIRACTTQYAQFDTCERELAEHTNVLGVVLNAYGHERTVSTI